MKYDLGCLWIAVDIVFCVFGDVAFIDGAAHYYQFFNVVLYVGEGGKEQSYVG